MVLLGEVLDIKVLGSGYDGVADIIGGPYTCE